MKYPGKSKDKYEASKETLFISDEMGHFDFRITEKGNKAGWRGIPLFTK